MLENLTHTCEAARQQSLGRVQSVPIGCSAASSVAPRAGDGSFKSTRKPCTLPREEVIRRQVTQFEIHQLSGKPVAGDGELGQLQLIQPMDLSLVFGPVVNDVLG